MLFDTEHARHLSDEYERQVSAEQLQRALRAAQRSRPSAIEWLIEQGLYLVDFGVRSIEEWGQIISYSMRWLAPTRNK